MNRKQLSMCGLAAVITFFAACKGKQGDQGIQGLPGPSYTGAISGHIMLYDQYGTKVNTNLSGIQVTLSNPTTTVTTDANGYYIFTGVKTGDYSIFVHDPNTSPYTYGDNMAVTFQYLDDTLNRDIKLSANASFAPTTMNAYTTGSTASDSLVFTFTPDSRIRSIIVFVNNNSTVTSLPGNYLLSYVKNIPANATIANLVIPANDLHDQGINTGSTAYYAAYGYPVTDESVYEDLGTGKNIYNSLSSSFVTASATAP